MSYIDRIQSDLTAAMKEKDELRLSVLRMVKSALKHKEIEEIHPLDDLESLQVLQTLVKQRHESGRHSPRAAVSTSPKKKKRKSPSSNTICQPRPATTNSTAPSKKLSTNKAPTPETHGRRHQSRPRPPGRQNHRRQSPKRQSPRPPNSQILITLRSSNLAAREINSALSAKAPSS